MPKSPSFVPSPNVASIKESATIAVSQRAKALRAAGRAIIDLGAGEPDFDTPPFILDATKTALDAGATRYTAVDGILPLREAIAADATRRRAGREGAVTASEVVVSTGSKQSLHNATFTLFGPGDEVLLPVPSWVSYFEMVGLARATAVEVPGDPARGLKVTPALLEQYATPRTRGLMLNSPTNPTGAVYDAAELRAIADLAASRGWWVISDEIYGRITYRLPEAPSMLDVAAQRDNLVVVNGVAKAYAMTGFRIGWSVAPRAVSKAMTALQSHTTSNAATESQYAALAALTRVAEADAAVAAMVSEFRARRDAARAILTAIPDSERIEPDGAFYLYFKAPGGDGTAFATRLLEQEGIAVVPGAAFGTPEWVRASYAAARADVEAAMHAIVRLWRA
ncbi:MAG: pyridoxal phosphate-dependent aminotransferase [Gemmatimonadaceae bacterium]|nr:pyridoxal phosphate-dependent aminotransferase [Gemmatimonadaceae bacterium]